MVRKDLQKKYGRPQADPWGDWIIQEMNLDGKVIWEETRATLKEAEDRLVIRTKHRPHMHTFRIIDDRSWDYRKKGTFEVKNLYIHLDDRYMDD